MKCPRCNGRKYIELDKIGILVSDCPLCHGTGEGFDMTGKKPIVESDSTEGYATLEDIPAGLDKGVKGMPPHSMAEAKDITDKAMRKYDNPETELLNDFNEVLNGNINGDNIDSRGRSPRKSTSTEKPKAKRRTRKKTR